MPTACTPWCSAAWATSRPTAADVEQAHAGPETELAADQFQLVVLGVVEGVGVVVGAGPVRAGVGHRRAEHDLVELIADVVVVGHRRGRGSWSACRRTGRSPLAAAWVRADGAEQDSGPQHLARSSGDSWRRAARSRPIVSSRPSASSKSPSTSISPATQARARPISSGFHSRRGAAETAPRGSGRRPRRPGRRPRCGSATAAALRAGARAGVRPGRPHHRSASRSSRRPPPCRADRSDQRSPPPTPVQLITFTMLADRSPGSGAWWNTSTRVVNVINPTLGVGGADELVARHVNAPERDRLAPEEQRQRPVHDDPHLPVQRRHPTDV